MILEIGRNPFYMLRFLRIASALLAFVPLLVHFVVGGGASSSFLSRLEHAQFIPSILHGLFAVAGLTILATVIFGRLYCSVLCPLGVLQDCVAWLSKRWHKKKKYHYAPPKNRCRLAFFLLALIPFFFGVNVGLVWLDPYSIFGRIASNLFAPIYNFGSDVLSSCFRVFQRGQFQQFDAYDGVLWHSISASVVGFAYFVLIFYLAWRFGRFWCNSLCPVGAFLGFLSKYSLFRVRIDKGKCVKCGLCESNCKSMCIDSREQVVDASRCVDCFNCFGVCRYKAISWSWSGVRDENVQSPPLECSDGHAPTALGSPSRLTSPSEKSKPRRSSAAGTPDPDKNGPDQAKRDFLASIVAFSSAVVTAPMMAEEGSNRPSFPDVDESCESGPETRLIEGPKPTGKWADVKKTVERKDGVPQYGKTPIARLHPVTPPGSVGIERFNLRCTACHLCVSECPAGVLRPARMEYGWKGFLKPRLDYARGSCQYDCALCTEVCPSGALLRQTTARKRRTQIGRAVFVKENCIVLIDGTDCGACAVHCPTHAVTMVPLEGTEAMIPEVDPEACLGCGACEYYCPSRPWRAMYVEGSPVHQDRRLSKTEKENDVNFDDLRP